MPSISCSALVKRFGVELALNGLDLIVRAGETVAVMGPSGSGKSTLLHCLAGLIRPDHGTVRIGETDVWALGDEQRTRLRRERIGMVFQSASLVEEFSALDNVMLPALAAKVPKRQATDRARDLLEELGVADQAPKRTHQMSGGQRQRVAIARALINGPAIVLADEPTGSLDRQTSGAVLATMLAAVEGRGGSLLLVTHDEAIAEQAQRVVRIEDGRVNEGNLP